MTWIVVVCLIVVAAAVVIGMRMLAEIRSRVAIANRLRKMGQAELNTEEGQAQWKSMLAVLAGYFVRPRKKQELLERMAAAGLYENWHTDAFILVRIVLVVAAVIAGYLVFGVEFRNVFRNPMPMFKWLVVIFVCGRVPDFWLRSRISVNRDKIVASVPQAIDFMTICVESGLSLEDSFARVGEEMRCTAPEVASEFRLTRSEMIMLDRVRSLQRMKKRSGVREIENLADALLQSIRFGTPLVDALQSIAQESRAHQVSSLEEKAGAISAKIGLPLILFVLFPLIVLLAAPAVVMFARAL